ncbi:MAG: bifunctional RNase H/acid phosphatase [Candidatus Nanopelagicales bacterium]
MRLLIVEADGGSRGNPGPAAYGALVRDAETGEVLVELAEHIGVTTNNVAEYQGLVAGLRAAHEIDPGARVEARLDSKLVVEQMSGRWSIKNATLRAIALEAREVLPYERVSYRWVPREQNMAADRLVNESLEAIERGRSGSIRRCPEAAPPPLDVVGSAEEDEARAEAAARPANKVLGWAPDLGPPMLTLLARHGASEYSLEKRFSGRGGVDVPLAPVGREQAEALAVELERRGGADVVVTSPLLRTRQTAGIVARRLGLQLEVEDGFAECAFGEWDGRTFAEVRDGWPVELEAWLASADVAPPGGESFAEVRTRVDAARRRLHERHPTRRVVVVSHVSPIKLAVGLAIDAPLHSLYRMELAPCSLTSVAWYADGNASLLGFAESAHLRDVPVPDGV